MSKQNEKELEKEPEVAPNEKADLTEAYDDDMIAELEARGYVCLAFDEDGKIDESRSPEELLKPKGLKLVSIQDDEDLADEIGKLRVERDELKAETEKLVKSLKASAKATGEKPAKADAAVVGDNGFIGIRNGFTRIRSNGRDVYYREEKGGSFVANTDGGEKVKTFQCWEAIQSYLDGDRSTL